MSRDRAAYMREYRARRRGTVEPLNLGPMWSPSGDLFAALARVSELEAEVARLKRELAARPVGPSFNSRGSRPVPKK